MDVSDERVPNVYRTVGVGLRLLRPPCYTAVLTISSARLQDLWRFGELSRHGFSLVRRPPTWSPLWAAIRSHPPVAGLWPSHTRTFALRESRRVSGFAQTTLRREPDQWEIMYLVLAPAGSAESSPAAAERRVAQLLSGICEAAEAEGATRLFARLPEGAATVECFRRWGFDKVLTEHTYVAQIQARSAPPPRLGLRAQRPADAYPLWQLYRASTPAVVQTAEALSSRQWDLPLPLLPRWLLPRRRVRGWVVPGAERPLAWVQLALDGHKSAVAEVMVDPDASDLAADLLDYIVAQVGGNMLLTCTVREQQTALRVALEDRGFGLAASSDLMVKRLAVPVLQRGLVPILEKVAA